MGFSQLVFSDLSRYRPGVRASWLNVVLTCGGHPGMLASVILRMQQAADGRGHHRLAGLLRTVNLLMTGLDALPGCRVGSALLMHHPSGIVIGSGAVVGNHVTLLQHVTLGERYADGREPHAYPSVEDGAVISVGACVLGGVRIGRRAIVGANAVVLHDVPDGTVVAGVPATVVGAGERPA